MSINPTLDFTGQIGIVPRLTRIETTDKLAIILQPGYLSSYGFDVTDVIFIS